MHRTRSSFRIALLTGVVAITTSLASLPPASAGEDEARFTTPALTADYRFGNTLQSSVGTAPDLTDVGPGSGAFGMETVAGTPRPVYQFPRRTGVELGSASTVIPRNRYTIVLLMRFARADDYRRIINFVRPPDDSDTGLYVYDRELHFYDSAEGSDEVLNANEWVQVVLTRTKSRWVKGYVDGVRQFTVNDAAEKYAILGPADILRFFRDDSNREESAGSIARLRLYDGPMSEGRVAGLKELPPWPNVITNPYSGSPGDTITVDVANFGPFERVNITFRDDTHGLRYAGRVTVDRAGNGSVDVSIKNDTPVGNGRIRAKGTTTGLKRAKPFTFVASDE